MRTADAVNALLDSFPPALCNCSSDAGAIAAHMNSPPLQAAAKRARVAAAALADAAASGDEAALDSGLAALHDGLRLRAPRPGVRAASSTGAISRAQLELLRMLFVCAVLLLDASIGNVHAPPSLISRHASATLLDLSSISLGAVAVPQLPALEVRLLTQLAELGELQQLLLDLCAGPGNAPPPQTSPGAGLDAALPLAAISPEDAWEDDAIVARRAIALRWTATALASPALAPPLWSTLPAVLEASTKLPTADVAAHRAACVSVVTAALSGLAVNIPEQREWAAMVLEAVRACCAQLVQTLLHGDGTSDAPAGSDGVASGCLCALSGWRRSALCSSVCCQLSSSRCFLSYSTPREGSCSARRRARRSARSAAARCEERSARLRLGSASSCSCRGCSS